MNMATQPLRELAEEIFVGSPAPRGKGDDGDAVVYPVINVRDLVNGRIVPLEALEIVCFGMRSAVERYQVREGDVLLTSRGTQLKVALVGREVAGAVATSNLLVIRPGAQFPGAIIYAYLRSTYTEGLLMRSYRSSSGLVALTAREVGEIPISVPPDERRECLARLVEETEQYYHAAMAAAQSARDVAQGVMMAELCGSARRER